MSYTKIEEKSYSFPRDIVYQAAKGAVAGLEGKILQDDQDNFILVVKFHKTVLGKVLGDRTHLTVELTATDGDTTQVKLTCYPLDAVGRKLMFGARKGVSRTILTWFSAHLEHRLPKK